MSPSMIANNKLVTLNYTLREWSKDGKILETTVSDVAKENKTYSATGRYEPFQVMIGGNGVIPGFEKGLLWMKKGEKKVIEVSPELGYGTGPTIQTVSKFQIAPVFTTTQDKKYFEPTISQTIERENLNESMKNAKVGETLTGANGASAKVISADEKSITINIKNSENPFFGKKIAVGTKAEAQDGSANFKIVKISGTGITLEITNKQSPFYNKDFSVWSSLVTPQGKITIREIKDDSVVIAQEHPLMGKTLFFDVEILEIQ